MKRTLDTKKTLWYAALSLATLVVAWFVKSLPANAAACTPPSTDYGTVTSSITIPSAGAGTYRIWSRVQVPDSSHNTYLLEIDGSVCFTVGGSSTIPANAWYWVSGTSQTNYISTTLAAGTHTIKMIGNTDGVSLDRVIFTQDTSAGSCLPPTGTGDPCANPPDTTPPSVAISSPAAGATIAAGTVTSITATASDDSGTVAKVEFYVDGVLKNTDTNSPFSYSWDTSGLSGSHSLSAKAYDSANNAGSSSAVTVSITTPGKTGDVNGDGLVNGFDISKILTNWNKTPAVKADGDLSNDGKVNGFDLSIVLSKWGT